jgi:DNA-binding GntR family transcriptional regulator
MSPGATFERVYLALKEQLGTGRFPPGAHLEPAALSEELSASVTPVRDALHRLLGERLITAPRGEGFRTPLLTEAALRDLYRWNAQLLNLALRSPLPPGSAVDGVEALAAGGLVQRTEAFFLRIAAGSGSGELHAAVAGLNDRLRSVRTAEGRLLTDLGEELQAIEEAYAGSSFAQLRAQLAHYHRRRDKATPQLLASLLPLI